MYKNKADDGRNNICGKKIREIRLSMYKPRRTPDEKSNEETLPLSQKNLADMLKAAGLDVDKNAVQKIESGQRFVTDIELKIIAKTLNVSYEELLDG